MQPDAARSDASESGRARLRRLVQGASSLLRLELKVVTGNRALVLVAVEAVIFVVFGLFVWFGDPDWDTESFYNRTVLVPALVPAIVLSMAAVLGDRDSRQLEVTFVSPGGRFQVWAFRFSAILGTAVVMAAGLSLATWATLDQDFRPFTATLHVAFPLAAIVALTAVGSVATKSSAVGGLVVVILIAFAGVIIHPGRPSLWDPFLNPFVPPEDLIDPMEWVRLLFWNRIFLTTVAAAGSGLTLWLLQRRERLL